MTLRFNTTQTLAILAAFADGKGHALIDGGRLPTAEESADARAAIQAAEIQAAMQTVIAAAPDSTQAEIRAALGQ